MAKPNILVVLGPTSSGKSDLAVELALRFNGEVISADSRQVYKGLDIGSGKITKKEMEGVPHHMLNIVSPKKVFTASDYQAQAHIAIAKVLARGKLPIVCGGTGFYIQSIVDNISFPDVGPNKKLRMKLETYSVEKLMKLLTKLDPTYAKKVDAKSNVRLIRAIEIATALGKVPHLKKQRLYNVLQIGIETSEEELKVKIKNRLFARLKKGMIAEVKKLHEAGLSWKRMFSLGLEYRHISLFLQNKITQQEMFDTLEIETRQYARRQKTWFRRDKNIEWFDITNRENIIARVTTFLKP